MNQRTYPTAGQKARLIAHLQLDVELSEGKFSCTFAKKEAAKRWIEIAEDLNSIPGAIKTWVEWRKTWQDIKCSIKKKKALLLRQQQENNADLSSDTNSQNSETMSDHLLTGDSRLSPVSQCISSGQTSVPVITVKKANILEISPLNNDANGLKVSKTIRGVSPLTNQESATEIHTSIPKTSNIGNLTNTCLKPELINNKKYTYKYFCQPNVCRLCWAVDNYELIDIDNDYSERILECIEIDVSAHIPSKICGSCREKIDNYLDFKKSCQEADLKLKAILSNGSKLDNHINICKGEMDVGDNSVILEVEDEVAVDKELNPIPKDKTKESVNDQDDFKLLSEDISVKSLIDNNAFSEDNDCHVCDLNFDSSKEKLVHNLKFHQKTYKCRSCMKVFRNVSQKLKHELEICEVISNYQCKNCSKHLPTQKLLDSHMKVHISSRSNASKTCKKCFVKFEYLEDLQKHMYTHRKVTQCICETCGRIFKSKKHLEVHKLIHTSHKKLQCPHCDYRATQPVSLKYHIRLHTGEKPYACDQCSYRSVNSSNLKKHIKGHKGVKDFKCFACDKEYVEKKSLRDHIASAHEGIKNHICKRCGAEYYRLENLRKHMLSVHGQVIRKVKNDFVEVPMGSYMRMSKDKMGPENIVQQPNELLVGS